MRFFDEGGLRPFRAALVVCGAFLFLMGGSQAQTSQISPFCARGRLTYEVYRLGSSAPVVAFGRDFTMWNSNEDWEIELSAPSGEKFNCKRIPEGIRLFSIHTNDNPNALVTAETLPLPYPPPGRWDYLACWFAFRPSRELPIVDGTIMRRFLSAEMQTRPENRGEYVIERETDGLAQIKSLELFSDGSSFTAAGAIIRHSPPFDHGYLELKFGALIRTNWNGVRMPLEAHLQVFAAKPRAVSSNDIYQIVSVRIETRQLSQFGESNTPVASKPPAMMALDSRPFAIGSDETLNYVVTNDTWESASNQRMRTLIDTYKRVVKVKPRNMTSTPWRRGVAIAALLAVASAPVIFLLRKRRT